jgi:(R,R)-butanediol dehydrogenase / meso-butanediol dehydrogenase / diacetyl reductase
VSAEGQMRAGVYHGHHDVRIEKVSRPEAKGDEVLLKVLRTGMCGTDATEWKAGPRTFPVARPHPVTGHVGPMVLGHEFVGEVIQSAQGGQFDVGEPATGASRVERTCAAATTPSVSTSRAAWRSTWRHPSEP